MSYKSTNSFDKRLEESNRIRKKYPDRIPIVCEKSNQKDIDLPKIDKCKFLVPLNLTIGQLLIIIRSRMKLPAEKAIFLFIDNIIPPSTETLNVIYENFKDTDGFLYINYSSENVFG